MKIAVASEGKLVSGHFGHCEGFNIFTAQDKKITSQEYIISPGHGHASLPNFLSEMGVNLVISGGMGSGAIEGLNKKNIEIITGAAGEAEFAVNSYLQGNLKSSDTVCQAHEHGHDGCQD